MLGRTAEQAAVDSQQSPEIRPDQTSLRSSPSAVGRAPQTQGIPCVNPDVMEQHRGPPRRSNLTPLACAALPLHPRLRLRIVFHFLLHGDGMC